MLPRRTQAECFPTSEYRDRRLVDAVNASLLHSACARARFSLKGVHRSGRFTGLESALPRRRSSASDAPVPPLPWPVIDRIGLKPKLHSLWDSTYRGRSVNASFSPATAAVSSPGITHSVFESPFASSGSTSR